MAQTFLPISTNTSTGVALVTGVSGYIIEVYNYTLVAAGNVAVGFGSGTNTSNTALTGAMSMIAGSVISPSQGPERITGGRAPLFATKNGDGLMINLGAAVQVSGHLEYRQRVE